jgi:hypothetical protein
MSYNDEFDFVNFSDEISYKTTSKPIDNNPYSDYDETTNELYRILRLYKFDPITNEEIPKDLIFEFKYKWDPLTGERTGIDELGPLCFNALNLHQYYYSNRHKGLWYLPVQQYQWRFVGYWERDGG